MNAVRSWPTASENQTSHRSRSSASFAGSVPSIVAALYSANTSWNVSQPQVSRSCRNIASLCPTPTLAYVPPSTASIARFITSTR